MSFWADGFWSSGFWSPEFWTEDAPPTGDVRVVLRFPSRSSPVIRLSSHIWL